MNRAFLIGVLVLSGTVVVRATSTPTNLTATAIIQRVLANRPLKDFSLKARLFVTRDDAQPVELLIKNLTNETRTIFRGDHTELLSIQPQEGEPRLFLRGTGALLGAAQTGHLLGSQFSYYDVSFPFLHWPHPRLLGDERSRGRDCFVLEVSATNQPYARVKMWIDEEFFGLLRAEAFDKNGTLVKRFAVTSLKRIGDYWMPRTIEIARVDPGQALPSEERSRLEIYTGNYKSHLPAEWFSAKQFWAGTK